MMTGIRKDASVSVKPGTELRPFWDKLFNFNWVFGLVLIFSICIPRFISVLNANKTGNYNMIAFIMIISAITPFLFLSKYGREKIGMVKPSHNKWMIGSFVAGALAGTTIFVLGYTLYSDTYNNWFVYIGQSYKISSGLSEHERLIYFLIYAVSGMTFSPIGEELFFRGIVHASFAKRVGDKKASIIDSLAFALIHLSHFGIVYVSGAWKFLLIPSILWVLAMFITGRIFFQCKKQTGSIWGSILSHAGFNLAMIYFIFFVL